MDNYEYENRLFETIEILNKEKQNILNSKSYKLGNRILDSLMLIKKQNFNQLFVNLRNKRASRKLKIGSNKTNDIVYEYVEREKKIAVYTCIAGNYDSIALPLVKFDNVDFFLLTDNPKLYEKYSVQYNIIQLPKTIMEKGSILANRYVKFHPKEFFSSYDYAIYLDGNVRVVSDIRKFVCKTRSVTGIAMHRHRERNCIFDEAEACRLYKRGNIKKIDEQIKKYESFGFPTHFGMNEATIIASDLNNEKSILLLDDWWNEFVNSESFRDQIAWPYILWSHGFTIDDVGNLGNNIYSNYVIEMLKHK